MTESKFNVGDKVYDILLGIGSVTCTDEDGSFVIDVLFLDRHECFTSEGRVGRADLNPTLLTLPEARAKGYDVPKETVKKTEIQYCLVFRNGVISGQRFRSRVLAKDYARNQPTTVAIAECVFTWEEEI